MTVSLSVVIPSATRADLLQACLASLLGHAPMGTEILVVDDGSENGLIRQTALGFAGVEVLSLSERRGFCAAANAGLRRAQGEIVQLLNDDTEVTHNWAESALKHFKHADMGAVAPLVLCWPDGEQIDSAGDSYHLAGIASKRGRGTSALGQQMRAARVFGASGSSAFYRRAAVLQVGAFPEHFGAYFEDVDLAFRLNRAGYQTFFEPSSRILHHVSASYGRPRRDLLEQQSRNEELVFWRNMPWDVLPLALPLHAMGLAAKAYRRWQEGSLVPFVRGKIQVVREVREVVRHRRDLIQVGPATGWSAWPLEWRPWRWTT